MSLKEKTVVLEEQSLSRFTSEAALEQQDGAMSASRDTDRIPSEPDYQQ